MHQEADGSPDVRYRAGGKTTAIAFHHELLRRLDTDDR